MQSVMTKISQPDNADISLCEQVSALTTLAILNADLLHIHMHHSPHTGNLHVYVTDCKTDYCSRGYTYLLDEEIWLNEAPALEQLRGLEDKLIELIADAKDKVMGAV